MLDAIAYAALGGAVIVAALFLLWFGNHTAGVYARIFGHIPKPPQIHQRPVEERVVYRDAPTDWNHTMVMCSAVSYISALTCAGGVSSVYR